MKIALARDGITYEVGITCTFQICITGSLPPEMSCEEEVIERLLALLEQTEFFKHTAATLKTSTYQEKRRNHNDADDETLALFEDDVPF